VGQELVPQPVGGEWVEAHQLAARDHRLEHPPQRAGQQDQVHERRWLLERLQHPVGHLVVHQVDSLEHEHALSGLERRPRRGRDHRLLDVVHAHDVCAARDDPGEVGVRAVRDTQPDVLRVGRALGEQLSRQRPRRRTLAGPGRAVEQIRVRG